MTGMSAVLALLVRSPADPRLKERLASFVPDLDDRRDLVLAFIDDLMPRTSVPGVAVKIACTPPIESMRISRPSLRWDQVVPQVGATFSERLNHTFGTLARAGFSQIVLLGSDIPDLPAGHIAEACALVQQHPHALIIGPTEDASVYLLGMTAHHHQVPDVVSGVRWGTPDALGDVIVRADACGLSVVRAPRWQDIDTPEDLAALSTRLQQTPEAAPATARVLERFTAARVTGPPAR
jgi:glycosyltransferase A (GT-A) superfamily protein (DUF2064 family)